MSDELTVRDQAELCKKIIQFVLMCDDRRLDILTDVVRSNRQRRKYDDLMILHLSDFDTALHPIIIENIRMFRKNIMHILNIAEE
jgi:hypothetical protein